MILEGFLRLWPASASQHASDVDWLITVFTLLMGLFVLPVFFCLVLFALRYRAGRDVPRHHQSQGNWKVETTWIVLPFIGAMVLFLLSARLFYEARVPPADALEIRVTAKQWMWKFQHPGGQREINTLHVPADRPVKLVMISEDAIHSLFFPALRIKQDVLPGRYTELWFRADRTGRFDGFCAEYCGTDHSGMTAQLVIQPPAAYQQWLQQAATDGSLAEQGAALFRQFGCSGCHSERSATRAPLLQGLYGRRVALADGDEVVADAGYIRDSIMLPSKQVVAGFEPIMPTYARILDEDAVLRLTAYIQSLGEEQAIIPPKRSRP
ncbi:MULTISPECIES: cytochrome c oxidase subunit II [Stutzerimonas]|jgi:cytochrome c oxidase subunit 2|uniref:Cytochrome aa3 subunit 2 n=1 Tax=Stutzerimonas balearica DSM 6083 TaxID=1123016 RepID=A0ABY0QXW3_9GAMM|nr:cytochrome c oxidase subunit II [Stutzerimonas balearica]KIL03578.1 cytochrome B561 [Stutzerimonas stutzeri]MCZ4127783.1 cytochrome c oxidase subunit II [Stutzerimonas balearica]SDM09952.1 cytochrome c oxidase subunit 2 [Stutzerimonas balearica DSM 6083]